MAAIDEDLQSRQLAVYGKESMLKLSAAHVLIVGVNGLGAEIAKNVILANVKSVSLYDPQPVELGDMGAHFYVTEADVGRPRAEACVARLQELNPTCLVQVLADLSDQSVLAHSVVVAVGQTLEEAVRLDQLCHANLKAFIRTDVSGLFGSLFVDCGPKFIVNDVNGETLKSGIIEGITLENGKAKVQCVVESEFDFDDDDYVVFKEVEGLTGANDQPVKITNVLKGKKVFEIENWAVGGTYIKGGVISQVKMPKELSFRPLATVVENPGEMFDIDNSKVSPKAVAFDDSVLEYLGTPEFGQKFGRSGLLHLGFRALDEYRRRHGFLPEFQDAAAAEELVSIARAINDASKVKVEELDERAQVLVQLSKGARAVLSPMAAIFGGIAGQEVIKACTGKFHPTMQCFYMDALECLSKEPLDPAACRVSSRYAHQIGVFGPKMHDDLTNFSLFLVGSGALGCEFIKNFAMMGVSTQSGAITVTDDDIIEKSNLTRQFLFRNHDVGTSKSLAAAKAAKVMNSDINIVALQERVQPSSENIFNDEFWRSQKVVVNALDNIKARLYVDQRCLLFEKPLLESGTLGPKCNVQVVIPHKTENYGASKDPDEKEAPQCAIHNFPHNIDHCLGLSRSEFVGNFETIPSDTNTFIEKGVRKAVQDMIAAQENEVTIVDKLIGDLRVNCGMTGGSKDALSVGSGSFEECVEWARLKFESYFVNRVKQLIHNFPEDATTSTGKPFWSPPKRFPRVVEFDPQEPLHMQFIVSAANLRARMLGYGEVRDVTRFLEMLTKVVVAPFKPFKDTSIETGEEAAEGTKPQAQTAVSLDAAVDQVEQLLDGKPAGFRLHVEEFEKDDDLNFHMDFISSFANIRAINYGIPPIDQFMAKLKAGRIIPAIATATAVATGFVSLELLKLLQPDRPGEDFRNVFANLALPLFAQSEPMPPAKVVSRTWMEKPDPLNHPEYEEEMEEVAYPDPHTAWDRINVQLVPGMTLQQFMDYFKNEHKLTIYGWSVGKKAIYHSMMASTKRNLPRPLLELVQESAPDLVMQNRTILCLDGLNFQNDDMIDVVTPQVVLTL